jgi:hypothetical protein
MTEKVNFTCEDHKDDMTECNERSVEYNLKMDSYGLPVFGEPSVISIDFCPWCGTKLSDRSKEWWSEMERLGIDPFFDDIPEKYKSDAWYREEKKDD